ncbi:MAG TPA: S16 family serine protease [Actinomycetaceae bacterium]|nr:S16 family serine protease [Actinomycetaceae bacterium]
MRLRRRPAADRRDRLPDDEPDLPLLTPRVVTAAVASGVAFVLALAMVLISPPYAIQSPGPTIDTLGEVEDVPLITIEGTETFPPEGELRLTTVSTRGGPGYPATTAQVVRGWLSSTTTVVPREVAFDPDQTQDEVSRESNLQMSSSQVNASVAALTALGQDVPTELWVAGTAPHGASAGVLEEGDRLRWIADGPDAEPVELTSFAVLSTELAGTPPASEVVLGVQRGGEELELAVVTSDDGDGGSLLGVYIEPEVDLPIDVEFAIENIGGPSAGLMLALGIVDLLTPGDLSGGEVVAGTGTIDLAGDVGPIGGVQQKMAGAVRDGASWFLAPVENCDEVVGAVPGGLEVVAVDTLEDAVSSLEQIAADQTSDLPRCPSPDRN